MWKPVLTDAESIRRMCQEASASDACVGVIVWPSIDTDCMNLNQAAHGDREFGHIESRVGVDRKIVAGHATDPRVVRRIAAWARAAVGRHTARGLRDQSLTAPAVTPAGPAGSCACPAAG